jgi:predicted transcriptional regulator
MTTFSCAVPDGLASFHEPTDRSALLHYLRIPIPVYLIISLRKTNCHPEEHDGSAYVRHWIEHRAATNDRHRRCICASQSSFGRSAGGPDLDCHQTLSDLGKPGEEVVERTPAVSIRRSVHRNYVICIECGWRGFMLRRHLSSAHGLTPIAYRARWGLSREHLLTAPAYSERRSSFAKQIGLGQHRRGAAPSAQRGRKMASKAGSRKTASRGSARPRKTSRKGSATQAARRRLKRA